jgi:hypothetical protein
MGWDVFAYWVCFISGLIYAGIAALLGGVFGLGHGGVEAAGGSSRRRTTSAPRTT